MRGGKRYSSSAGKAERKPICGPRTTKFSVRMHMSSACKGV